MQNASPDLVDKLRNMHIVDCYTKDSAHHDKVLIAAGKLLNRDEFPKFIATVGGPIIEQMLPKNSNKISAEIQFCISVPTNHLSLISQYTKEFVKHINDQKVGLYVIRLFACLGEGEVRKYEDTLIALLSKKETLDAVAVVIPFIADKLKDTAVLLPLLSSSLVVPERFAMFLADLFPQNEMPKIITALLPAELKSPLEKPLCRAIESCTDAEIETVDDNAADLDAIHSLLIAGKCASSTLLLFFRMAKLQLFECKDHTQQRLVLCPQFVIDTTMMKDVLKLLVSSLSIEELQQNALNFNTH